MDYYKVLEIDKNADASAIKKSYLKLAKEWHPDKHQGDNKIIAETKFKEIGEAYSILSDPEKRSLYDNGGLDELNGRGGGFNPHDIFSQMFGSGGMGGMGGIPGFPGMGGMGGLPGMFQRQEHENHIKTEIELTIKQMYSGCVINHDIERSTPCKKCINVTDNKCGACNGKGVKLTQLQPGFMQRSTCGKCRGKGVEPTNCSKCNGTQIVSEPVKLEITIKPGVYNGYQLIIENEGHYDTRTNKKTNVICVLNEKNNSSFKRDFQINDLHDSNHSNLLLEQDISFVDSICGVNMSFKHLDNHNVNININYPIRHNDIYVLKNEGMPKYNKQKEFGDLIIKFIVQHPNELNLQNNIIQNIHQLLTNNVLVQSNNPITKLIPIDDYIATHQSTKKHKQKQHRHEQEHEQQQFMQPGCHTQ